jgi:hypothetical protein
MIVEMEWQKIAKGSRRHLAGCLSLFLLLAGLGTAAVAQGFVPVSVQPLGGVTACAGETVPLTAVASGDGPLAFAWSRNGFPLAGETNSSLTLFAVHADDAGIYTVQVSGPSNSVSATATLAVNAPLVMTPLFDVTACPFDSLWLDVDVSGTGPFVCVWRKDGEVIKAETNAAPAAARFRLTLKNISPDAAAVYTAEVISACGSGVSECRLSMRQRTTASIDPLRFACAGETVTLEAAAGGDGPFFYEWWRDGEPIPGANGSTLTIANIASGDVGSYTAVVLGACNFAFATAYVSLIEPPSGGAITAQTVCAGSSASFTTAPSGSGPLTFVWRHNGALIPGATNAMLVLSNVSSASAGAYSVEAVGACGSVTNSAVLTLREPTVTAGPAGLAVCDGQPALFSVIAQGEGPFTFLWRKDGVQLADGTNAVLSLAAAGLADAGDYSVEVSGVCNTVTNSARLTVNALTAVAVSPPQTMCAGGSAVFTASPSGTGPFAFQWSRSGIPLAGQTNPTLVLSPVALADAGSYEVSVQGACNAVSATTALAVLDPLTATALENVAVCAGGQAAFSTAPAGTGPFSFQWRHDGAVIADATNSSLVIASVGAADVGIYSVEVAGACGSVTNSASLAVTAGISTTALPNLNRCPGTVAIFSTTPSGAGPFRFIWRKDGAILPGQTNSSLLLAALAVSNSGAYSVEVSGACGTATTSGSLSVFAPPAVGGLAGQTVCEGATVTLSPSVSGATPMSILWRRNGSVLAGQTNASLVLSGVGPAQAGTYSVEVTGPCRSATNSMVLSIRSNVAVAPLNHLVHCPGDSAAFTASVSGSGEFSIAWRKDGVLLPGQTNTTLNLAGLSAAAAGTYSVEVTGPCNNVTRSATLSISAPTTVTALQPQSAAEGGTVVLSTTASGVAPFTYLWRRNGGVIAGATSNVLVLGNVTIADAGLYSVTVGGGCGEAETSTTVAVGPGLVTSMDATQVVCSCSVATLGPTVSGTGPFAFQWFKDSVLLAGETNQFLTLLMTTMSHTPGLYTVITTDGPVRATNSVVVIVEPAGRTTFANTNEIVINESGPASAYPSTIPVRFAPVRVNSVTVTLHGVSHSFPDDIDIMLVNPAGQSVMLWSDCGGGSGFPLDGVNVTFADGSPSLPDATRVYSGRYAPTSLGSDDDPFLDPAPGAPSAQALSALAGDPNGEWSLYVVDDHVLDGGVIAGGWSLSFGVDPSEVLQLGSPAVTNGVFSTTLNGPVGFTYFIEASADFRTWTTISTNYLDVSPKVITNNSPAVIDARFFRAAGCSN